MFPHAKNKEIETKLEYNLDILLLVPIQKRQCQ